MRHPFQIIFESLIDEADYNKFDRPGETAMQSVGTAQNLPDVTGTGEYKDIDANRNRRQKADDILDLAGKGNARANNVVEREFIIAQIYKGLRERGNSKVRLTYPTLDIIGAVADNPVVDDEDGEESRKYQVVNTSLGATEEVLPVYYTINTKFRAASRSKRPEDHSVRSDSQSFASETYNNPQDSTDAFADDRLVQKTRGSSEGGRDDSGIGAGLVPQYSKSGLAISHKSGTNTVSKNVYVATRHLTVDDLRKFITRAGASNGIAGHFDFDVKPEGGTMYRIALIPLMQKLGEKLTDGTFRGEINAVGNEDIITGRQSESVNPGVDNEYFYLTHDIPVPGTDELDWTGFLEDVARSSRGFNSAVEIFGGLDSDTLYALYAKCAIPVRLSRIYLCRLAGGSDRTKGLAMAYNNIQNRSATPFARNLMHVLANEGVEAGKSYKLPGGDAMFVFQKDTHDVVFPNREYKDNKYVDIKGDRKEALELDVDVVGGVIVRNGREYVFRLPVCRPKDGNAAFIFMRYGNNDRVFDKDADCSTPEKMLGGTMVSAAKPIMSIKDTAPEYEEAYQAFLADGRLDSAVDLSNREIPKGDNRRVNVTPDTYAKRFLSDRSRIPDEPVDDESAEGVSRSVSDQELADMSPRGVADLADRMASQGKAAYDEYSDSKLSDEDIDEIMHELNRKNANGNLFGNIEFDDDDEEWTAINSRPLNGPNMGVPVGTSVYDDTVDGDDNGDDIDNDE